MMTRFANLQKIRPGFLALTLTITLSACGGAVPQGDEESVSAQTSELRTAPFSAEAPVVGGGSSRISIFEPPFDSLDNLHRADQFSAYRYHCRALLKRRPR